MYIHMYVCVYVCTREELKCEKISCVLQEALTTHYMLRPRAGQVLYLEHTFTNTHNQPLSVTVAWKNSDLRYNIAVLKPYRSLYIVHYSIYISPHMYTVKYVVRIHGALLKLVEYAFNCVMKLAEMIEPK